MAKQNQAPEARPAKDGRRAEPAVVAEQAPEAVGLALLASGAVAAAGDGSIEAQAGRLRDRRLQSAQRQALARQIGRVQGNHHLQCALATPEKAREPSPAEGTFRPVATDGVQRAPNPPGGGLVKVPYSYAVPIPMNYGKYVKITQVTFKVEGSIEEMPAPGGPSQPVVGPVTIEQSKGKGKDVIGISREVKREADGWFADKIKGISSSFKPYTQENYSFQRSDKGLQGKASYESGVDISPFITQSGTLTFAAEFSILEFKAEEGNKPEFEFFKVTGKGAFGGSAKDFPVAGFQANLKGEVSVDMEPDYVTLAMMALKCPATWVLAAAAGGAAIVYFTLEDIERRQRLGFRIRAEANALAKAANSYGSVIVGDSPPAINRHETRAMAQAQADLEKMLAANNMTRETYLDLLMGYKLKDEYFGRAVAKFRLEALSQLGAKVETEIRAWHDAHFFQTFFSGVSAEDDIAGAELIVAEARESGGEGWLR